MEQKHRTILRHQWSNIRDNLEPNNVLPKLVLVLTETDEEEIREQSTRQERCDKLLHILPTRGENAFNVFVNALVKEAPHLASELTEADKKTEDELNHAREQSAKLRGEIRKLKTELEAEKQNHEKTLQELKELKSLHGKENETKEVDITLDGLQKKETTTESLSQKEQDQTGEKEIFEEDERLLQKCDYVDEKNKQEKQSENLEAAKEEQEKIRQLQWENKQLKEKVTEKTLEFEKMLALVQQIKRKLRNSPEKIKDKDVLPKDMRVEKRRLHEESNAERSRCDALSEEVRRLREMPGHESCSRCEGLKNERDSARRKNETLENKIQEWRSISEVYLRQNQELQENLKSVKEEDGILQLSSRELEAAKEEQQQKIRQLQRKNTDLGDKVTKQTSEYLKTLAREKKKNKKQLKDCREHFQAEAKANIVSLENMTVEKKRLQKEIKAERSKCDDLRKEVKRWREMPGRIHNHKKDFDTNGVVYALAKTVGGPNSIQTRITATRSSDEEGKATDILENRVDREIVSGTMAEKESWWCVDLTENYALYLTDYTLRHGYPTINSFLLNWQLEGSLDGENWQTLSRHVSDRGLKGNERYQTHTWAIDGDYSAFRYFRIFQTGKNSSGNLGIFLSGIELCGVLIEKGSQ